MRLDPVRTPARLGLLACILFPLAGCGQSDFTKQMTAICAEEADPGADCGCIVGKLDAGLPDRLKPAFSALRWPLKPAPQDRERVFNEAMRAAGVDPVDRQAVQSIQSEFRDAYQPLREQLRAECGGDL